MASLTPRASGLWTSNGMNHYEAMDDSEDVESLLPGELDPFDSRTPLDRTIDRIGMGSYQWTLLSLCGFGWLADNMWIQAVAIILPRVQRHFLVSDQHIGLLSSSMFGGMMFGAVGWGTCSDLMGRTTAFNATLFLTSLFGVLASFANTFPLLCLALFFLGSAVGGSMPTDGTLLLEHMPNGKQYLVTALSVFFSFGAVLSAIVGLFVIPGHSCPPSPALCDIATQNMGWKYLLIALGMITMSMFIARIVFFRLHESPRYLVHAGRPEEAIESLQLISKFNGSELSLGLDDVADHHPVVTSSPGPLGEELATPEPIRASLLSGHSHDVEFESTISVDHEDAPTRIQVLFEADPPHDQPTNGTVVDRPRTLVSQASRDLLRDSVDREQKDYNSTGSSNTPFDASPVPIVPEGRHNVNLTLAEESLIEHSRRPHPTRARNSRRYSTSSSLYEIKSKVYWKLPRWFRKPLCAWIDRIAMVLAPEWFRTTVLVWAVWCSMSLAYTMFNVYLPKLLEGRPGMGDEGVPKSLNDSLWDVVIYSVGGCPGAILGAYMVDSRLGRRWSLAGSTFVTAFFCVLFVIAQNPWAVRASTVGISLSATTMWAVLYGWTPEIFGTKVRGTACGIASALSRIGGMIAPILGGSLLMINVSFPVYASIVIFLIAGVCVLLLKENEGDKGDTRASLMH
ncbi:unnamed protein product [Somion occarium]|uniref:Major facilitator superfamily (MFS) profile domain-containing protein n=1 Tax=Somion occarium TaxID=3059160 RepID=A0ABP1DZU5_9APHY